MRFADAVRQAEMVMRSLGDGQERITTPRRRHGRTPSSGRSLRATHGLARVLSRACGAIVRRSMSAAAGARQRSRHGAHRGKSRDRTFSSAGLDDEDILASHALFNLNARLAALELVEQHLGRRYAEVVADGPARGQLAVFFHGRGRGLLGELRVRAAAQDDDVADHGDGWWWGKRSFQSLDGEQT
jgi:hypothetical protein